MLEALAQWPKARLWWTLGLGYFSALELASWLTSRIPPCVVHAAKQDTQTTQGDQCPSLHVFLIEGAAVVFEKLGDPHYLVAFATVALFVVTGMLWWATRALVKNAEETAKRQLRAYVSIETFSVVTVINPNTQKIDGFHLVVHWQNTGATPTRDLLTHTSVRFDVDEMPEDFRFPDMWIIGRKQKYAPHALGPQGVMTDGNVPFSVSQLQEVRSGKKFLYLYGWADYNDVFLKTPRHRTEFCVRVVCDGDPALPGDRNIGFNLYWKHNGTDDECMRKPTTSIARERLSAKPPDAAKPAV